MGSEIIALFGLLKDIPVFASTIIGFGILAIAVYMKIKDKDIETATSLTKNQNDRLNALMNQNSTLLGSVEHLQTQVRDLHKQISVDAEEHRTRMDEMYKVTDEMRKRIMELEDLVRTYQRACDNCLFKKK